jgi:hypothetical protein
MRSFLPGIVILMAVPAFAAGQQRPHSERSAAGRTATPREEAVQAAPARQTDRRAEPRGEPGTPAPRDEKPGDGPQSRAGREPRSSSTAAEAERGRWRDGRPQAVPLNPGFRSSLNPGFRTTINPGFIAPLNPGFRSFPDSEHRQPGQRDGDYLRYRRPRNGAHVVFVPYAVPVVIEHEVVDEAALAPVIVEQPSPARLVLDIHPPTAQVFADGYYIGIPEDFRFEDGGAVLEPGPHRIDILERGYEPLSFDVNLTRGQSATFRRMLTPTMRGPQPAPDAAVKAPAAPKQPATFYLIPGCYMGNVPPKDANLPATCDMGRALSFQY